MTNNKFTRHLTNVVYYAVIISSVVYAPVWISSLIVIAVIILHLIAVLGFLAVQGNARLDMYNKTQLPKVLTAFYCVVSVSIGFLISWKLGTVYAVFYLLTYLVFVMFSNSFMESVKKDIDNANARCLSCGVKIEYDPDVHECSACDGTYAIRMRDNSAYEL